MPVNIYHILVRPQHSLFRRKLLTGYVADAILNSTLGIPLRGAAIGNGWIDGRSQYPSFLQYAVKHNLIEDKSEVCLLPFRLHFGSHTSSIGLETCEGGHGQLHEAV